MKITCVFSSFMLIFQRLRYVLIFFTAVSRRLIICLANLEEVKKAVSSAYKAIWQSDGRGTSYVKMLYNVGDNTAPCGTPNLTSCVSDKEFKILT